MGYLFRKKYYKKWNLYAIGTHATGAFMIALGGSNLFTIPNISDNLCYPIVPRVRYHKYPNPPKNAIDTTNTIIVTGEFRLASHPEYTR